MAMACTFDTSTKKNIAMKAKITTAPNMISLVIPKTGFAPMLLLEGVAQQHGLSITVEATSEKITALFYAKDHDAAKRVCSYINANL